MSVCVCLSFPHSSSSSTHAPSAALAHPCPALFPRFFARCILSHLSSSSFSSAVPFFLPPISFFYPLFLLPSSPSSRTLYSTRLPPYLSVFPSRFLPFDLFSPTSTCILPSSLPPHPSFFLFLSSVLAVCASFLFLLSLSLSLPHRSSVSVSLQLPLPPPCRSCLPSLHPGRFQPSRTLFFFSLSHFFFYPPSPFYPVPWLFP